VGDPAFVCGNHSVQFDRDNNGVDQSNLKRRPLLSVFACFPTPSCPPNSLSMSSRTMDCNQFGRVVHAEPK
jgi:hypothetical protein